MANGLTVVNTRKVQTVSKISGNVAQDAVCVHTIKAQDLRITRTIPGEAGLGLVLKLGGI